MLNIAKYLEKFTKNVQSSEIQKNQIIEILKQQTDLDFTQDSIEIKKYILYIESSPAVKNKIFLYKKAILENIASSTSIKITDIR
ncbi:MAG: hypothetical protein WCK48_03895 [bacterium]